MTGRPDQPVTAAVAQAECWAAKALAQDGISEAQLQAACAELGLAYWPPNVELVDPEEGFGAYQTLSWLLGWDRGYRGGRVPPLPCPRHPALHELPHQRSTVRERPNTPSRAGSGGWTD